MRPEKLYLTDIVDAADAIGRFVAGINCDDFLRDELRLSAVLQKLIVIGEAAARLSPSFQASHPVVEWVDIVAFRNIAVHEYFAVNWSIVWVTATEDVPFLKQKVAQILAKEYADES
ncbi:MAG: HepT-like ribonuclease domain-containing protein [Chloroflexota bacterium]